MFESLFSMQGLSLDRLRNFLAFAEAKSIVQAAGGDTVRQSLISRQIRELEEFFGVELVRRQGRGLGLTEAGRRLAIITREQFGALADFAQEAKAAPATLSVVTPNSIAIWLLMPRLAQIRRKLPHHHLVIHHEQTPAIIRGVLEGVHDVGLLRETALPTTLGRSALGGAGFALFASKALVSRVNPKDPLTWLRLPLALSIGGSLRESVNKIAARHGITLHPAVTCDSYVQAAAAVESGVVASILPVIAASAMSLRHVQMIPIPELVVRHNRTLMIWSKRTVATRASVSKAIDELPSILTHP
jgi:DNA-binding transcriptional LysR family regulator